MQSTKEKFHKINERLSFRVSRPSDVSDAQKCRDRGWTVGTRLVGDEGYGPTVIQITGIGESGILAKTISHNGIPEQYSHEGHWTLSGRDWKIET